MLVSFSAITGANVLPEVNHYSVTCCKLSSREILYSAAAKSCVCRVITEETDYAHAFESVDLRELLLYARRSWVGITAESKGATFLDYFGGLV